MTVVSSNFRQASKIWVHQHWTKLGLFDCNDYPNSISRNVKNEKHKRLPSLLLPSPPVHGSSTKDMNEANCRRANPSINSLTTILFEVEKAHYDDLVGAVAS